MIAASTAPAAPSIWPVIDLVELTTELAQVGSSSYIESRARTDYAFLKPGEIRFEVVNPDALEGYTEEEMKILMQELVY